MNMHQLAARLSISICAALLFFTIAPSAARAEVENPLVVTSESDQYSMARHWDIYEDAKASASIGDLSKPSFSGFVPNSSGREHFGWTKSALWFRANLVNKTGTNQKMYLYLPDAWIDHVTLYLPTGDHFQRFDAGDLVPYSKRAVPNRKAVFEIPIDAGESQPIFVLVHSPEDAVQLSFQLMTEKRFRDMDMNSFAFGVFFFGCMAVMGMYNLLIYFSIRDKSYLIYVIYIFLVSMAVSAYKGFSHDFIWSTGLLWNINTTIPLINSIALIAGVTFARQFLQTAATLPKLDNVLKLFSGLAILNGALAFLPDRTAASILTVNLPTLYSILLTVVGFQSLKSGNRYARFFLASFIFSCGGIFLFGLRILGFLTYNDYFKDDTVEIGLFLEVMFLSLALGDKLRNTLIENEQMSLRALEQDTVIKTLLNRQKEELEAQVTERTAQLRDAKEVAELATRQKDQFVTLVSHDLMSPLASMRLMLEQASKKGDDVLIKMKKDGVLNMLTNSTKMMLNMISNLLDHGRLQTGAMVLNKERLDARETIERLVNNLAGLAQAKNLSLTNDVPAGMTLFADPALYEQAMHNLISNAIKFTPSGGAIVVSGAGPSSITVTDTGVGINEKLLGDLFKSEIKTTTFGTDGERGTGLGLPYAHSIMAAHGGALTVETKTGQGSIFKASLPHVRAVIMVVDDQPAQREAVKKALKPILGLEIVETGDGAEALQRLQKVKPAVVITDLQMPVMDGRELIKNIRTLPGFEMLPVIVVSGIGVAENEDMRAKATDMGANDFLQKPLDEKELIKAVGPFLGGANLGG